MPKQGTAPWQQAGLLQSLHSGLAPPAPAAVRRAPTSVLHPQASDVAAPLIHVNNFIAAERIRSVCEDGAMEASNAIFRFSPANAADWQISPPSDWHVGLPSLQRGAVWKPRQVGVS
jgi:hypothetical protein